MRRRFFFAIGLCGMPVAAQAQDDKLKARCAQLYSMADRALSRRAAKAAAART